MKEESESGYDESGSTSLYYADEMSGSGSSDWKDDNDYGKHYCLWKWHFPSSLQTANLILRDFSLKFNLFVLIIFRIVAIV